jgi:hypothetical protein
MKEVSAEPIKGAYRTSSDFQWEDRRLVLRGGKLDGRRWTGLVGVGKRVFCGDGPWSTSSVYLVTAEVVDDGDRSANVAVPAFAGND